MKTKIVLVAVMIAMLTAFSMSSAAEAEKKNGFPPEIAALVDAARAEVKNKNVLVVPYPNPKILPYLVITIYGQTGATAFAVDVITVLPDKGETVNYVLQYETVVKVWWWKGGKMSEWMNPGLETPAQEGGSRAPAPDGTDI